MERTWRKTRGGTQMADEVNFGSIDAGFENFDEQEYSDLRINPSFYIHHAMLKSQECMLNPNFIDGMQRFQFMTILLEGLCRASNMIGEDYDNKIKLYKESSEYINEDQKSQRIFLALKKQELLANNVFNSRAITNPLKVGFN